MYRLYKNFCWHWEKQLRWSFFFCFLNSILLVILACRYWKWMHIEPDVVSWSYILTTQIGLFGGFAVLLSFFIFIIGFFSVFLQKSIGIVAGLLISFALLVDTIVYNYYRFHINWFVLEFLLEDEQIIGLSWLTWVVIFSVFLSLCLLQIFFLWLANNFYFKSYKFFILIVCLSILYSQTLHVWKDATYDTVIPGYTPHFPVYFPLTAKRKLAEMGWIDKRQDDSLFSRLIDKNSNINYPLEKMQFGQSSKLKNILFIVIDACRYDAFNGENMPNVFQLSQSASVFHQHRSGGNSTLAGIFSLFYGLPRTYWEYFLSAQRRPVMMEVLEKNNYDFMILSSSSLKSPAFDRTVFSGIQSLRLEAPVSGAVARDLRIKNDFISYLNKRDDKKPFFGFLFFDSAHRVDFPKTMKVPFTPYWKRVDHLKLDENFDPEIYHNRYKNAVYYVDQLIGEIVYALEKKKGLLENTVIVITSDHGEEFNDNKKNYWGHGSNFSDVQIHVPLILYIPGRKKEDIYHRTSHFDVPTTLLEHVFNLSSQSETYSVGYNLYQKNRQRDWLIIGSYTHYAIVGSNEINEFYPGGIVKITDGKLEKKRERELKGSAVKEIFLKQKLFLH